MGASHEQAAVHHGPAVAGRPKMALFKKKRFFAVLLSHPVPGGPRGGSVERPTPATPAGGIRYRQSVDRAICETAAIRRRYSRRHQGSRRRECPPARDLLLMAVVPRDAAHSWLRLRPKHRRAPGCFRICIWSGEPRCVLTAEKTSFPEKLVFAVLPSQTVVGRATDVPTRPTPHNGLRLK